MLKFAVCTYIQEGRCRHFVLFNIRFTHIRVTIATAVICFTLTLLNGDVRSGDWCRVMWSIVYLRNAGVAVCSGQVPSGKQTQHVCHQRDKIWSNILHQVS